MNRSLPLSLRSPFLLGLILLGGGRAFGDDPAAVFTFDRPATALAYSPDGKTLAAACSDGLIQLLDGAQYLRSKNPYELIGHTGFINGLAFSPDGKLLASCGRGPDLKLWDTATWKLLADLETHEDHVT